MNPHIKESNEEWIKKNSRQVDYSDKYGNVFSRGRAIPISLVRTHTQQMEQEIAELRKEVERIDKEWSEKFHALSEDRLKRYKDYHALKAEVERLKGLFEMVAINGGGIVSSASLSPIQIASKQAQNCFFVDGKGLGYAWVSKDEALTWAVNDNQTT